MVLSLVRTVMESDGPMTERKADAFRRLLAGEPAGDTLIDYRLQIRESSAKSVAAKGGGRK